MRCPSCFAHVRPGDTICEECGTELVVAGEVASEPAWLAEGEAPAPGADLEDVRAPCPDCGERVVPDDNERCPVCGFRLGQSADELRFDRRLQQAMVTASGQRQEGPLPPTSSTPANTDAPHVDEPLPSVGMDDLGVRLEVEGTQAVLYEGAMVRQVPLEVDELWVGRADPADAWLPDVDLSHLRATDPHISRRHVRFLRARDGWYVEDHACNDATWIQDRAHVLHGDRVRLVSGDRVLVSESLVLRFVDPDRDD